MTINWETLERDRALRNLIWDLLDQIELQQAIIRLRMDRPAELGEYRPGGEQ